MTTQIFQKGTDTRTGLNITIQQTGYFHNEEASCIEIYYKRILNYPNGQIDVLSRERIIVQDTASIPAQLDSLGNVISPSIEATMDYTNYCNQFNATAIAAAIDAHLKII